MRNDMLLTAMMENSEILQMSVLDFKQLGTGIIALCQPIYGLLW